MKNGKTYHWCTGPGHQKVSMWVIHELGTCNASTAKHTPGTPQANVTTQSGAPPAWGGKGKNKFKAKLAQALANHNTFGDDTSKLIKEIMDKYEWKLYLWISICRPLLISLILLYWLMYYYPPPPILLYLVRIFNFASTNPHLILLVLFLYWIYPYWPPHPPAINTSNHKSHGLQTYPDASLVLPQLYLVLSAIQLHPHLYWYSTYLLAEKHLSCNYPRYLANYILPMYLCALRAPKYVTGGFQVYQVLLCSFQAHLAQLFSNLGGSTWHLFWHKPRFRPFWCMPLFSMLALNTAMCYAVFIGKVPLKLCRYTHPIIRSNFYRQTSFSVNTVLNSEHLDPHIVDFVLFDNCANRTVSPVKSDFYYLEEFDGDLTGVGKAPIKGIGTLHWQIKSDKGCIIDIIVEDALYCPKMQHKILSVTQWGKQYLSSRKDELPNLTRIVTRPDENYTVLYTNCCQDLCTIVHANDLPKGRCTCPNNITFTMFVHKFQSYNTASQPVHSSPDQASRQKAYAMSHKDMKPEPQL